MMTPIPDSVIPEVFNREYGFLLGTISPIEALGDDNLNANWNNRPKGLFLRKKKGTDFKN
jgi:hypothetical protein